MPSLDLTQTDLNVSLRGATDVDIIMFLPDKNVSFPSNAVTVNRQPLSYTTNLQSLVQFSSLPQANLATFENNSWILDGSFISPSETYGGGGDSYTGYISNELTDDSGDYATNPILTVTLAAVVPEMKYISIKFAGGVDTSYPKIFKVRTYDNNDSQIREHTYDMSAQTGLPLLVAQIDDNDVKKVEFEFVGTVCPHRRSRLNKIMFGKAEQVDNYYLQSWKVDDKASLVADSIPTKSLEYNIINYEGDYNIDNPGNKIPQNYNDVLVLFTLGMEVNGLWKYTPTKTFNLVDVSTTPEGIVTFSCGSLLDILVDTYDHDIYSGVPRTISEIISQLLAFSGIGTDQIIYNGDFANYEINIPLPELPVREIIQRLAFSCGATLTVNDDNKIVFSMKNIVPNNSTPKFMFNRPEPFNSAGVLLEEPNAEALANTTNIAMYTYDSKVEEETSEVGSANVTTNQPTKITFSPVSGAVEFDRQAIVDQGATLVRVDEVFSQHAIITVTWPDNITGPIQVKALGQKVETTKIIPKTTINPTSVDTLLLDSGLALNAPFNLDKTQSSSISNETFYYTEWYGAKFKYICKTRNEYLIKAGDIVLFETPFSNGQPIRVGYVLRNTYSDGENGEMELIMIPEREETEVVTVGNN